MGRAGASSMVSQFGFGLSLPQGWIMLSLYSPWCRYLERPKGVSPQLYAATVTMLIYILAAAQYTVSYVKVVGHGASRLQPIIHQHHNSCT